MRNLVWQTWTGGKLPDTAELSKWNFQRYAKMHGAEYMLDTDNYFNFTFNYRPFDFNSHGALSKMRPFFDEKFDKYDKILIVDMDVLINDFEHNIFNVPVRKLGVTKFNQDPNKIIESVNSKLPTSKYNEEFVKKEFSGGLLVLTKEVREYSKRMFGKLGSNAEYPTDEGYLKGQFENFYDYVDFLDFNWNFNSKLYHMYNKPYFVHFHAGMKKYMADFFYQKEFPIEEQDKLPNF